MKLLDSKTILIPAGTAANPGTYPIALPGEYFLCYSATAPFQMQLDNDDVIPCAAGFQIQNTQWSKICFYNPNNYAIGVTFFYGSKSVSFSGLIQSKNAATYLLGNTGLASGAGFVNANGFIQLSKANFPNGILLPGVNNGNNRLQVIFSINSASANNLNILDANGFAFMSLGASGGVAGSPITFQTSGAILLQADNWNGGGLAQIKIGEIFYAS